MNPFHILTSYFINIWLRESSLYTQICQVVFYPSGFLIKILYAVFRYSHTKRHVLHFRIHKDSKYISLLFFVSEHTYLSSKFMAGTSMWLTELINNRAVQCLTICLLTTSDFTNQKEEFLLRTKLYKMQVTEYPIILYNFLYLILNSTGGNLS